MRLSQIVIAVTFSLIAVLAITSLRSSHSSQLSSLPPDSASSGVREFFSFHIPLSLFPPSALISLTHDNKTVFLARPAAFGPSISPHGLSGQVWIGGGFDGIASSSELGCSDVQGWSSSYPNSDYSSSNGELYSGTGFQSGSNFKSSWQNKREDESLAISSVESKSWMNIFMRTKYATDDNLFHPLDTTNSLNVNEKNFVQSNENHSDIQSLQEAAEITGKVVLLNRGGCGFLDKVKWSQSRGAVALIVGANTQGGPLIQMFARGDTSNITIPSVFTSYSTAKLLYKFATSRKQIGDKNDDDMNSNPKDIRESSDFDIIPISNGPHGLNNMKIYGEKVGSSQFDKTMLAVVTEKLRRLSSLFASSNNIKSKLDQSRPPSSGRIDLTLVNDQKVENGISHEIDSTKKEKLMNSKKIANLESNKMTRKPLQKDNSNDDFEIGIQDWRDPDLVGNYKAEKFVLSKKSPSTSSRTLRLEESKDKRELLLTFRHPLRVLAGTPEYVSSLKGGSITPSSGEYNLEYLEKNLKRESTKSSENYRKDGTNVHTSLLGDDEEKKGINSQTKDYSDNQDNRHHRGEQYEGLWVTLSSSSGASPFLDTLLVLVVSPLVTLAIVYVLLLIRSRYRQQKWRAPKSVVERLPVRTYKKIGSTGTNSPRFPPSSVTTPLLHSIPKSYSTSQTASNISELSGLLRKSSPNRSKRNKNRDAGYEKITSNSSTCKNQIGTQTECVVCLEEYIDGVSRIMALPCGHEFHVECITPWLTTRRRTCPMCKGDVVRSLARASRYNTFNDDNNINEEHDYALLGHRGTHISSSSETPTNIQLRSDLELGRSSDINHETEDAGEINGLRSLFMDRLMTILRRVNTTREDRN